MNFRSPCTSITNKQEERLSAPSPPVALFYRQSPTAMTATRTTMPTRTTQTAAATPEEARRAWRDYGSQTLSNLSEERRTPREAARAMDLVVRIVGAEARVDVKGSRYVAYLIEVQHPTHKAFIERRYSEFRKLYTQIMNHHQQQKDHVIHQSESNSHGFDYEDEREDHHNNDHDEEEQKLSKKILESFPSKSWWAGRLGDWTPSLSMAPETHDALIEYRQTALDTWLVEVVRLYNRNQLEPIEVHLAVKSFLSSTVKPPCDRSNRYLPSTVEESLKLSNPFSFTLGAAVRQATHMVYDMCGLAKLSDSVPSSLSSVVDGSVASNGSSGSLVKDQSIPLELLQHAHGLLFLTILKAGLVVSGKVGTGLLLKRRDHHDTSSNYYGSSWSAPCAVATIGMGWGAQIGGDLTHALVVLTTKKAVDAFCRNRNITLGAELGVAVGPVGRATQVTSTPSILLQQPAVTFCHSKGLFVGVSLEGSVVTTRPDVNAKFYGRPVDIQELYYYTPPPKAAEPLYHALDEASRQEVQEQFGPLQQLLGNSHVPRTSYQNQSSALEAEGLSRRMMITRSATPATTVSAYMTTPGMPLTLDRLAGKHEESLLDATGFSP